MAIFMRFKRINHYVLRVAICVRAVEFLSYVSCKTMRWKSCNNSTNFLLLVCECKKMGRGGLALQVRRQIVEHRQLPNRDTLSGIFLIVR